MAELAQQEEEVTAVDLASTQWIPVRRGGKLLFEYDPKGERVRVMRRHEIWVVDLQMVTRSQQKDY